MGDAAESVLIEATLSEVWDAYFDRDRWGSWVDGFVSVSSESGYPERGGQLVWRSNPAGRGEVTERVLNHDPRRLHRIAFADPESEGELETRFEIRGEQVLVSQAISYEILKPGVIGPLADRFFVRGQVARSLQRSLGHFKHEVEASERADEAASQGEEPQEEAPA